MPLYGVRGPNGRMYQVEAPEDASAEQIKAAARYQYLSDTTPVEDTSGFKAAASAGFKRIYGEAALTAGKAGLISPERAQQIQQEQEEAAKKRFTPTEKGWSEAPLLKVSELAGGSAPYMLAPLAVGAAAAGAATASPILAPAAGIIGALGAGAASTAQFTGSNIARQMETGKTFEEASGAKAALAAIPMAALDTLSFRMVPGIGRLFGAAGKEITEEAAKEIAKQTVKQVALDYGQSAVKTMTFEGLTEAAQQAIERAQAGLSITDPEARKEYFDSFVGGAVLGGLLSAPGRAVERGEIKSKGRALEQKRLGEEQAVAAQEQARLDAEAAAAKQTPEYLDQLIAQHNSMAREIAATPKPKKPKDATPEEDDDFNRAKTARDELLAAYAPVRAEYTERLPDIRKRRAEVQAELETGQKAIPGLEAPPVPATDEQRFANLTQQRDLLAQRQAQINQRLEQTTDQPQAQQGLLQQRTLVQQQLDNVTTALEKVAPPPAQAPLQQRADLSQQRSTLLKTIEQTQQQAVAPGLDPRESRSLLQRVEQLKQARAAVDTQLKPLGGPLKPLDVLQGERESFTTKLEAAKKASKNTVTPTVTKLLDKIAGIDEQIALYKPAQTAQQTLAFEGPEVSAAPASPQMEIPGLTQPLLPTRKFEAAPEAAPTAFDNAEEARKLSLMIDRKKQQLAQQEQVVSDFDDKAQASRFEDYGTAREAVAQQRQKADAMRQEIAGMQKQVEDLQAQSVVVPEKSADMQRADLEKKLARELKTFERQREVGDFEKSDAAYNKAKKLQEQIAAFPQADLDQGAKALQAYETALAEKIAAGREQSVERQRAANVAMAKAKADIQALMGPSEAAPVIQAARKEKQRDIAQQQRERDLLEAEGAGTIEPQMPAVDRQSDLRQTLQDIDRYDVESPSVFTSADDDARANAQLASIQQARNAMQQRAAAALAEAKKVPTRGLPPLNTAVQRAAAAEQSAAAPSTPVSATTPAPSTTTPASVIAPKTPTERRAAAAGKGATPKDTFRGKKTLRHASDNPNLTKFEEGYTGSRYEGRGGTFGAKGVYLDNTGQWTKENNGLFNSPNVYEVDADFKNAIVLSPNTVDSFIAALPGPPPGKLWGEDALVDALRNQGYDGIIVDGFGGGVSKYDDVENKFETQRKKLASAKIDFMVTQDQVFAFDPKSLTVVKKVRGKSAPEPKTAPKTAQPKTPAAKQTAAEKPATPAPVAKATPAAKPKKAAPAEAPAAKAKEKTKPGEEPAASLVRETVERVEKDLFADTEKAAPESKAPRYEPRPTTPITEAVREAVEEGRSLDVVKSLLESNNPMIRRLAENMLRMMDSIKRVPKLLVQDDLKHEGKSAEGLYFDKSNRVVMDRASLSEESLAHEYSHAVTLTAIREYQKNPESAALTDAQKAAAQKLDRLYGRIQEHQAFKREYGSESLEEFVSEVLSNESLRAKLDANMTGMFRRIMTAIMELLGIDTKSLSAEAFDTALALFQPPAAVARGFDAAPVASITRDGVFPNTQPKASAAVPQNVVDTVNSLVGSKPSIWGNITASALGLRIRQKLADNWAASEALLKKGVAENKVSYAQAMQMRVLMRVHNDTNRLTATSLKTGPMQFTKDSETGAKVLTPIKGPNAMQIAEELSKSKLGNQQFVENLFTTWLAVLRAERDGIGYDKLNFDNKIDAKKAADIKAAVNSDPATKEAFESARKIYREYNRSLLKMVVEAGVMSKEKAEALIAGDYVPYYRVVNGVVELHAGKQRVTIGSIVDQPQIKELVGGDEKILPVFSGMVQNTSLLVTAAVRNMQTKDFGNMIEGMGLGKVLPGPGNKASLHTARFKYKGNDYHVRLDPDAFPENIPADVVIAGLQGIKTAVPAAIQIMGFPARLLRKGVTRMPTYLVRQLVRDPIHAWMTTGGDFSMVLDTYKQFFSSLKQPSETVKLLEESGAVSSMVQTGDKEDLARVLRDIQSSKGGLSLNSSLSWLDQKAMDADAATRAAVYNEFRKKGAGHLEAMLAAAESMNFSRRGTSTSLYWLSAMVPFFNAQIQGIDSVYRAALKRDTPFEARMDATNKLRKRLLLMFGMTVAYMLAMQDDEAYKNATPTERASSWFLPIPGVGTLRVPIPFELGLIGKALPEVALNTAFGDTKLRDAGTALKKMVAGTIPVDIPLAVKPLIELTANYSFFTGAPIESQRERDLLSSERYRTYTPELIKMLGMGPLSPLQVEHLVRSYTGGLGMLAMSLPDILLRPLRAPDNVESPARRLSELPMLSTLFQPETGRGIIDAVYKDIEGYQQAANTYKAKLASGNAAEAAAFANEYANEIAMTSAGGRFRQQMGELAKTRRQIAGAPNISAQDKQKYIEEIKKMEIQIATQIRQMADSMRP